MCSYAPIRDKRDLRPILGCVIVILLATLVKIL